MDELDKKIMEKANFDYICVHNGKTHLRTCLRDAVEKVTSLSESQFCSVFGMFESDLQEYIDKLYEIMKQMGAE